MTNQRTGIYEGMFLFPQSATANLQEAVDHLKDLLSKAGATIINFSKWDDRRLAYEIDGNKRGVYFVVFFNALTSSISEIERRCNQSEQLLRMMVTRAEHLPSEIIEANEGAEELLTEIKLRGEKSTEKRSNTGSSVIHKEDKVVEEDVKPKESAKKEPREEEEDAPRPEAEVVKEVEPEEVTEA